MKPLFTTEQKAEIARRYLAGETFAQIALTYGCSRVTIAAYVRAAGISRPDTGQRFWAKVVKNETCWLWTGAADREGRGRFQPSSRGLVLAHRWAYEDANGPIAAGMVLRPKCDTKNCVNPAHWEIVDRQTLTHESKNPKMVTHVTGICGRGHVLTPDNVYTSPRGRTQCRECMRIYESNRVRNSRR